MRDSHANMPALRALAMRFFKRKRPSFCQPPRPLSITYRGEPVGREELFKYTNGRFLINEKYHCDRRYVSFDVDRLCDVAASAGGTDSPIDAIEKMEGGFSKALLMKKKDGTELIAKIPCANAGPKSYTTASEVATLQYVQAHTKVPVPKIFAWNSNPSNPVGAEYIIMEKAAGLQLFKKWGGMNEYSQLMLVKQLTELEAQLASIRFPAHGCLYLRDSMANGDKTEVLDSSIDPSGSYCIGPSCDRTWAAEAGMESLQSNFNRGPWPSVSSFGVALANREIARIENSPKPHVSGPPRGTVDEQIALLQMMKDLMDKLASHPILERLSHPALWHTDLHMGNIYVSDEDSPQIVSFIDWQSIAVSPLFLQARWPEFLKPDEEYVVGLEVPRLPDGYDQMDRENQELARYKLRAAQMTKGYEAASGFRNKEAFRAMQLPRVLRELFVRCGETWKEGAIPLRACLVEVFQEWEELGFAGTCPFSFSDDQMRTYEKEFDEYLDFHKIQEFAREYLETDVEGWISPELDFAKKQRQNRELLGLVMSRSAEDNKSPEEIRQMWPFLEGL